MAVTPLSAFPGLKADSLPRWFSNLVVAVNNLLFAVQSGEGSPENVVTAPVGKIYLRSDGGTNTTFYLKETGTGNTGWVAK